MQVFRFHSWEVTPREAIQIQARLRAKVIPRGGVRRLRLVAGADVAFDKHSDKAYVAFPYIPGLLSFREAPSLLRAFLKLKQAPDLIFIDGHGLAHPRSAGIACHIGVLLDRPVIGCAKSVLVGTCEDPGPSRGSVSYLYDGEGRVTGAAVRTRNRVRPVFVSIGHRIGLSQGIRFTLSCGKGYRIPEPLRQAHLLAEGAKREGKAR